MSRGRARCLACGGPLDDRVHVCAAMLARDAGVGWRIEVRGAWAGAIGDAWRPAIDGTLNQTGRPAGEASTFSTAADAYEARFALAREAARAALDAGTEDEPPPFELRIVKMTAKKEAR